LRPRHHPGAAQRKGFMTSQTDSESRNCHTSRQDRSALLHRRGIPISPCETALRICAGGAIGPRDSAARLRYGCARAASAPRDFNDGLGGPR
jgi:hypothetical protein